MSRTEYHGELYPDCPIRNILARISDKWSILVLFTLNRAALMSFSALHKNIPDISQKMLTVTLRTLEEYGFVKRQVHAEVPPRVECSCTDRAIFLLSHINDLIAWAKEHMNEIIVDRENHGRRLSEFEERASKNKRESC